MSQPRYPDVKVKLVGEDGNAFSIMARVEAAMKRAGVDKVEIEACMEECRAADYDHLLRTCMRWVDCS